MVDNIFTRIYGKCAITYLKTGDYSGAFLEVKKCGYRQKGELAVVIPSCHMRYCNNLELIQKIYDVGGAIVITDISHCDIDYLHSILGVNVPITNIEGMESRCCPSPAYCGCSKPSKNWGYYGIAKGFNGSINEFYYEVKNCCEKDLNKKILEGSGADDATLWLQMNVKDSKDPFIKTIPEPGISAKDATNDLTRLASAQNITLRAQRDIKIEYYDLSLWGGKDNSYGINISVYACHSQEDNSDYYYIEQEGVYNFSNNYIGQYKYNYEGALSKIEELYCSNLVTDLNLSIDPKYVNIMRLAPPTTEGKTSISSGLSFSLGGGVSFDQNGTKVSVKGGISVSNSRTITVNAVNVYNESTDHGSNAKWEYVLKETESKFSFFSYGQVDLIGASNSGHSTFNPFNQWIWRILPEGRPAGDVITCTCDLSVVLTSSRARLTAPGYTEIQTFNFPMYKRFVFDIKQAPSS